MKHRKTILFILLILLNLFTLYNLNKSKIELTEVHKKLQFYEKKIIYIEKHSNLNFKEDPEYLENLSRKRIHDISLVVLFPEGMCGNCIRDEVKKINVINRRHSNRVIVMYAGKDSLYLKRIGAEFSYECTEKPKYISEIKAFLLDKNANILIGYSSIKMEDEARNIFYNKVESLFNSL